jgi:neuraminyllactose-binding hemagglutinin
MISSPRLHGRWHYLYKSALVITVGAWLGLFPSCETPVARPALPTSEWGDIFAYSADLSRIAVNPPASVPVTIAVVNPSYKEEESSLAMTLYRKIGKGFSASLGTDLDKVLIAKGVTTTGPFQSLDELTYSEKKDAALTLVPRVFITAEIKYDSANGEPYQRSVGITMEKAFVMHVSGWVSFIMQEPLSGEKMWIKKLELDTTEVRGTEIYGSTPIMRSDGCGGQQVVGYGNTGNLLYDGRIDAMASALKQLYPTVVYQFQKYLDPDEMVALKTKGEEIRKAKVY